MAENRKVIRPGMQVILAGGATPLTVRVVSGHHAYCEWFEGTQVRQGTFEVTALRAIESEHDVSNQTDLAR